MGYRAFFSYSRADNRAAGPLHRALDTFRTPGALVGSEGDLGPVPRKLYPVFRDRTDLSGGGQLSDRIKAALNSSETLVVLCSPNSASSKWVNDEVATFVSLGRTKRIFPIIAPDLPDSKDVEADFFPAALRGLGVLAADLREIKLPSGKVVGDGRDGGRLKLIAGLLGVSLDQLAQRERARQRRLAIGMGIAASIFAVVAAAAILFGLESERQRQQATQARLETQKTAYSALVSLADAHFAKGDGPASLESLENAAAQLPSPERLGIDWLEQYRRLNVSAPRVCTQGMSAVAFSEATGSGAFAYSGAALRAPTVNNAIHLRPSAFSDQERLLSAHPDGVASMRFNASGTLLASGGLNDNGMTVWDVASGKTLWSSKPGEQISVVHDIAFANDDRLLLAYIEPLNARTDATMSTMIGFSHMVGVFDAATGKAAGFLNQRLGANQRERFIDARAMAVSPSGKQAIVSSGGSISLFELVPEIRHVREIPLGAYADRFEFLDETTLAAAGFTTQIVDLATGKIERTFGDGQFKLAGIALIQPANSEGPPTFLAATSNGVIRAYNPLTGQETGSLVTPIGDLTGMRASKGGVLVSGGDGCLYDVPLAEVTHPAATTGFNVALAPDGRTMLVLDQSVGRIVVGSEVGPVVYDLGIGRPIGTWGAGSVPFSQEASLITPKSTYVYADTTSVEGHAFGETFGRPDIPPKYALAGRVIGLSLETGLGMIVLDSNTEDQKLGSEIASFDLDTGEILAPKIMTTVNAWQARASFSPDGRLALLYSSREDNKQTTFTLISAAERGKFEILQELADNVRAASFFNDTIIVTASEELIEQAPPSASTDPNTANAPAPQAGLTESDAIAMGMNSVEIADASLGPPRRRFANLLVRKDKAWTPAAAPKELAAGDVGRFTPVSHGAGLVAWTDAGVFLLEPAGAQAISATRIVSPPSVHWIDTVKRRMLTGGGDGIFRVIDIDRGVEVFSLDLGTDSIGGITVTPDGRRALVSTYEESLRQVHVIGGEFYRTEGEAGWRPGFDRLVAGAPPVALRQARLALQRGEADAARRIAAGLSPEWKTVFDTDMRRDQAAQGLAMANEARATAAGATSRVFKDGVRDPAGLATLSRSLEGAAELQKRAAALNPQLPSISATVSLGQSVLTWVAGDYATTVQILRPAIKAHPNDGSLQSNLASALLALGQNEEAAAAFETADRLLGASSGDSRAGLALARARAGIPDPDLLEDVRYGEIGISSGDIDYLMESYLWSRKDAEDYAALIRKAKAVAGED